MHHEEVTSIPSEGTVIFASGPLTSETLGDAIRELTGNTGFYFYDAAAPIVTAESLNYDKVFAASRYDKGDADYLNCPMNEEEYKHFWYELTHAEAVQPKDFEKEIYFEGCMPVSYTHLDVYKRQEPMMVLGVLDKDIYAFVYNDFLCQTQERAVVMTKPRCV